SAGGEVSSVSGVGGFQCDDEPGGLGSCTNARVPMTTHPLSESGPGVAAVPNATTVATLAAPTTAGRTSAFSSLLELLTLGSISSCRHQTSTSPPGPVAMPRRPGFPAEAVNVSDAGRDRGD